MKTRATGIAGVGRRCLTTGLATNFTVESGGRFTLIAAALSARTTPVSNRSDFTTAIEQFSKNTFPFCRGRQLGNCMRSFAMFVRYIDLGSGGRFDSRFDGASSLGGGRLSTRRGELRRVAVGQG